MSELEYAIKEAKKYINTNWGHELVLIIKKELERLNKVYVFSKEELDEKQWSFFADMIQVITGHRKEYLIYNVDKSKRYPLIASILGGESSYVLNKKKIIKSLYKKFIYPLAKEMELNKKINHISREKALLHNELDKENSDDKRKPKLKCEDYIQEALQTGDKNLKREDLAKQIKKRIQEKYPDKRFSITTIRPKLSYIKLK